MRTMNLKSLLFIGLLAGLSACAGLPAPGLDASDATPQLQAKPEPADCLKYTGSHLPAPDGGCLPYAGRVYYLEDIQRTGSALLGEVLNRLGPL